MALLVLSLNISEMFNVEKANAIEKGLLLIAAIILMLRGRIIWSAFAWAIFIAFSTLISAAFTSYVNFDWIVYLRGLVSLITTLLFFVTIPTSEDGDFMLLCFIFLPLSQVAISAFYQAKFGISMFRTDGLTQELRLAGTSGPAFLSPLAAAGAFAAVFLADFKNRLYLLMVPVNAVILLLTAARMPALVFAVCCGSALLFCFRGQIAMKFFIFLGGSLAVGLLGAIFSDRIIERFESGSLSGREILWNYLRRIADLYPWFGVGLGHQPTIMPHSTLVYNPTIAAHDEYLRLLVEVGWCGSILMILGGFALFYAIWSSRRMAYNPIMLFAVIAFAIYSFTDNTISRYEANALLVVALAGCFRMTDPEIARLPQSPPRPAFASFNRRRGNGRQSPSLQSQSGEPTPPLKI
jgi:hypothetical protein